MEIQDARGPRQAVAAGGSVSQYSASPSAYFGPSAYQYNGFYFDPPASAGADADFVGMSFSCLHLLHFSTLYLCFVV